MENQTDEAFPCTLAFVHLGDGKFTRVDADDLPRIRKYKWGMFDTYAAATQEGDIPLLLHRLVTDAAPGTSVHHKNGKMDNRKKNLKVYGSFREHYLTHHAPKGRPGETIIPGYKAEGKTVIKTRASCSMVVAETKDGTWIAYFQGDPHAVVTGKTKYSALAKLVILTLDRLSLGTLSVRNYVDENV